MKAVTVDLWHTLFGEPTENFGRVAFEMRVDETVRRLAPLRRNLGRPQVERAYRRLTQDLLETWRRYEDLTVEERMARGAEALGLPWPDEELDAALRSAIASPLETHTPHLHEGALDALATLKGRGLALAIISNSGTTWGEAQRPILRDLGLTDLVDVVTFSDELRVRKPRPEIFLRTLEQIDARPEEAVHVGDRMLADVAGARGVGMKAVLFTDGKAPPEGYRGADAVLEHFSRLPDIVEAMG